jgi:branched-chain amino acid transport system permease protein
MKRLRGVLVLAVLLLALPIAFPDNYYVTVVGVSAGLHAILAVGLNLLMGYAGQISLGHAAFFGLGAYSSAILTTRYGWNPWPALLAGLLLTGAVAFLIARPVLRLKGHYLAMATLGFGIIVHIVLVQTGALTGGPDGLSEIPPLSLFGWAVDSDLRWYGVIGVVLLLVVLLAVNLIESRTGRALRALHGSEVAAGMMGIDTAAAKTGVFVLAALTAGLAGSLFAHQQAFVSPDSFNFFFSIELVTMVVLGGMASTYGAIFGALVLTFLPELLVVFEDYEVLIFGGILMSMMIFLPQGIAGGLRDLWLWLRGLARRRGEPHGAA